MQPVSLTPEQIQELTRFVGDQNEKLRAAGAESAEQAFGMGCGIGLLPTVIIILVLYVLDVINFVLVVILLGLALLALAGIVMLLASRARVNASSKAYQTIVEPEIYRFLGEHDLTRQQFDAFTHQLLPEDAPLQAYLSQTGTDNRSEE